MILQVLGPYIDFDKLLVQGEQPWAFLAESRGELALRMVTDHLIEALCPDIREPEALASWGGLLCPPAKEIVPASFISRADGADPNRNKPTGANALSLCLATTMVASL